MKEPELFALRSYIARAEVRLATMHGVAGAYISGAGLLVLLPIFYRDSASPFFLLFISEIQTGMLLQWPSVLLLLWCVPVACAFLLPLYTIYLLIEQLVILYFLPHGREYRGHEYFLPRFVLSPISMPLDAPYPAGETVSQSISEVKCRVIDETYNRQNLAVAIPLDRNTRERQNLFEIGERFPSLLSTLPQRVDKRGDKGSDAWCYDVRAGKAGLVDRTLVAEAARLELSLVRFNARIRVMAIRYFKSLLVLIWTLVSLFAFTNLLRILQDNDDTLAHLSEYLCLVFGVLWSGFTPMIVALPMSWIRSLGDRNAVLNHGDLDLSGFEAVVHIGCGISLAVSVVGLFICIFQMDFPLNSLLLIGWGIALVTTIFSILAAGKSYASFRVSNL